MNLRKSLFWTHLIVGMSAGLVILSMCFSGMVLAFEPQITAFSERAIRSVAVPATPRLDLETLLTQTQVASQAPVSGLSVESDPARSVIIRLNKQPAVYVNPYTGAVLGSESKIHQTLHSVEEWHRWLGSKKVGEPITGAAAIAFLGLSFSGIILWWPRGVSFRAAASYKSGLQGKARNWNWHTVTGFWLSLYIMMIGTTGVIMSYTWASDLLYTATGGKSPPPMERQRDRAEKTALPSFQGINRAFEHATQQVPGWKSISLRLSPKSDAPLSFFILHDGIGWAGARSQVSLDRQSGEVVKWEPYAANPTGRKLRIWTTNLHTGRAWGGFGQTLNFVTALGGMLLIWTGFALTWRRFRTRASKANV